MIKDRLETKMSLNAEIGIKNEMITSIMTGWLSSLNRSQLMMASLQKQDEEDRKGL